MRFFVLIGVIGLLASVVGFSGETRKDAPSLPKLKLEEPGDAVDAKAVYWPFHAAYIDEDEGFVAIAGEFPSDAWSLTVRRVGKNEAKIFGVPIDKKEVNHVAIPWKTKIFYDPELGVKIHGRNWSIVVPAKPKQPNADV